MSDKSKSTEESSKRMAEIDLIAIASKLWENRKFLIKTSIISILLGIVVVLVSPKEYSSNIVMVPQIGDNSKKMNGIAGLAAMAGLGLNDNSGGDILSPTIYPMILDNVKFKKELMYTKFKFKNIPQKLSLYEYYSNDEYRPFDLISTLKKYTIGLPFVIKRAITGSSNTDKAFSKNEQLLRFTEKENKVAKILANRISLSVSEKDGSITLVATMPESELSTEVANIVRDMLQEYITNFKIDKVKSNLEFIQKRYTDARIDYIKKQQELAHFQDANRNVILSSTRSMQEQLANDFNISLNVFSELAKQLEQAKIKVKDETPVLTVVVPAYVPNKAVSPRPIVIMFVLIMLGSILSSLYILLKDKKIKEVLRKLSFNE